LKNSIKTNNDGTPTVPTVTTLTMNRAISFSKFELVNPIVTIEDPEANYVGPITLKFMFITTVPAGSGPASDNEI
jgi:hypothetical protein